MRRFGFCFTIGIALAALPGCVPGLFPPEGGEVLEPLLGVSASSSGNLPDNSTSDSASVPEAGSTATISGSVSGTGNYKLFDLGVSSPGEQLTVSQPTFSLLTDYFTVVLFDENYNLVMRNVITSHSPLEHVVRLDASHVYVGVTPAYGSDGGDFRFTVGRNSGFEIGAPRPQTVWLNFGAGNDIQVHRRTGIDFAPFDGAMLGAEYSGQTQALKNAIVEAMREDYARYKVVIISSDEEPPPTGPHTTIHFGSSDDGLLGLADNVDHYNQELEQNAVVFVGTFADFSVMRLDADEMGLMIGNVASHELGHLLGLYHTRDPDELMDTTGTAWDLAGDQSFKRAALDASVFPVGMEDCPGLLAQSVGTRPQAEMPAAKTTSMMKVQRRAMLREFMQVEIHRRCGLCLSLDDH
ncbi:MAG: matrixin family metalloprotease [Planctomycetes bacterium]|nr:matrixin family metalloprotease [Planctomycetota bacterium]